MLHLGKPNQQVGKCCFSWTISKIGWHQGHSNHGGYLALFRAAHFPLWVVCFSALLPSLSPHFIVNFTSCLKFTVPLNLKVNVTEMKVWFLPNVSWKFWESPIMGNHKTKQRWPNKSVKWISGNPPVFSRGEKPKYLESFSVRVGCKRLYILAPVSRNHS